jgi:hypothetical protein
MLQPTATSHVQLKSSTTLATTTTNLKGEEEECTRDVSTKVETPIYDSIRELVTRVCKEHGVKY